MKPIKAIAILAILGALCTALGVCGCTSPTVTPTPTTAPSPTPAAGPAVLSITGMVDTPLELTLSDLNGSAQHYAMWQNQAGNSSYSGTGPYVLDLLNRSGIKSGATNVTFACTDPENSYSVTVTLEDLNTKYSDSIIAYNWTGVDKQGMPVTDTKGTLRLIVPAGGGKNQVDDITQITVT